MKTKKPLKTAKHPGAAARKCQRERDERALRAEQNKSEPKHTEEHSSETEEKH